MPSLVNSAQNTGTRSLNKRPPQGPSSNAPLPHITPTTCAVFSPPNLEKFLLLQIPLLYAIVPGAAEEDISLDGQALDAVIVRGLEVVSGANIAHHALSNLKHLEEKQ